MKRNNAIGNDGGKSSAFDVTYRRSHHRYELRMKSPRRVNDRNIKHIATKHYNLLMKIDVTFGDATSDCFDF